MPFVYILQCRDGTYYVGSTTHLELRLTQHQTGHGSEYTRHRLPVELVWSQECEHVGEAFALEKQIQNWSRRKRQALVEGRFDLLPALASRRAFRAPRQSG